jgi:hypothetical protein
MSASVQNYPYYKYIQEPTKIGMSERGTLDAMGKDIDGLLAYVEVLVTGASKASSTGKPLGNKYFLKTAGICADPSGIQQDRYIYINNVPAGNIPFISSGLGTDFKDFRGLIPGMLSGLNNLDPMAMVNSFTMGGVPECQELTMQTIDTTNNKGVETHYVATADIGQIDACTFPNHTNPVTNMKCHETFTNRHPLSDDNTVTTYISVATVKALNTALILTAYGYLCYLSGLSVVQLCRSK